MPKSDGGFTEQPCPSTSLSFGSSLYPFPGYAQAGLGYKHRSTVFAFSEAEFQVAVMVKSGLTIKQIAGRLNLSPNIIKTHRKNIRKKLNIQNPRVNLTSCLKAKMP